MMSRVTAVAMIVPLVVSSYAIWSNNRTYRDAEDVYRDLLRLKPVVDQEDGSQLPSFDELRQINSDIQGWLTVDGTKIDYPVVQGENNLYYMNKDIYKDTSLAGSIFLDSRNKSDFSDPYSIIYGHHMDRSLMFGDLDKFRDQDFFDATRTAKIITEKGLVPFEVLSVMDTSDSNPLIFDPTTYSNDLSDLYQELRDHSIHTWDSAMEEFARYPKQTQIIALVTCTSGQTGMRLVVFLYHHLDHEIIAPDRPDPHNHPQTGQDPFNGSRNPQTGDSLFNSPSFWLTVLIVSAVLALVSFCLFWHYKKKE